MKKRMMMFLMAACVLGASPMTAFCAEAETPAIKAEMQKKELLSQEKLLPLLQEVLLQEVSAGTITEAESTEKYEKAVAQGIRLPMGRLNFGQMKGERPEPPDGETPAMAEGERPELPNGEAPAMAEGERPELPDGEAPAMAEGERPELPNGETPESGKGNRPEGEQPEMFLSEAEQKTLMEKALALLVAEGSCTQEDADEAIAMMDKQRQTRERAQAGTASEQ